MTSNPPPPSPDNTTQLLGILTGVLAIGAAILNRLPQRKKKRDTDEHLALKKIIERDDTIADLQRQLDEREAELFRVEREADQLRPYADKVKMLEIANQALDDYNKLLAKELEDLKRRYDLS